MLRSSARNLSRRDRYGPRPHRTERRAPDLFDDGTITSPFRFFGPERDRTADDRGDGQSARNTGRRASRRTAGS